MIVNIYKEKYFTDILVALTENGIMNVQVVNSVNESRRLAHNVPLFAGFKEDLGEASPHGKILCAAVQKDNAPEALIQSLKNTGIDFLKEDLGSIILLPVEKKIPQK